MTKKIWLLIAVFSLISAGCNITSSGEDPDKDSFTVRVSTNSGSPLSGAVIEGGIDWESFEVVTDSRGIATLPSYAKGEEAIVHIDNYFPRGVTLRWPYVYRLTPTPKKLRALGSVTGLAVRFDSGRLATVDYHGGYHLYAYDAEGVSEIASAEVPPTIKQTQVIGDTLWLSTHDDGVYAYSLADPFHPQALLHLAIPGNCPTFALRDHLIVVGNYNEEDSLGVYVFEPDGGYQELARFGDFHVSSIAFVEGYLVVTNFYNSHPKIYDLSEPANPVLVYDGAEPEYWTGFLYGTQYILIPKLEFIGENTAYRRLDLTDPASPQAAGVFQADARLIAIADDGTAAGSYHVRGAAISVLQGSLTAGYTTTAIVSDDSINDLNEFGGCSPPYFIIGHRLWILEDRPAVSLAK